MDPPPRRAPKRKDDRVVLQFVRPVRPTCLLGAPERAYPRPGALSDADTDQDYDCFYASVFEQRDPALKGLPLGVRQKGILATCNYAARARGVVKLTPVAAARKVCPELVVVDGEDLSPFRDVSRRLYRVLGGYSWNGRVERLGLDEVFMGMAIVFLGVGSWDGGEVLIGADVTDIVDYNVLCLNRASLASSFFHLSRNDPENGFPCDLTRFAGCVEGGAPDSVDADNPLSLRVLLGSHLAHHLRSKLEDDHGYTSTCGIATNKLLAKLAGSRNKPRNQTTLLPGDEAVTAFLDGHPLRKIPWIGSKTSRLLHAKLLPHLPPQDPMSAECKLTAGYVRTHPDIHPASLESLLGGSGAEKGVGERVWGLLHGVDDAGVKRAGDVPAQISIEDTYRGLDELGVITGELRKICRSLIRRMRVDLVVDDENPHREAAQRWIARPRTLRLSINAPLTAGPDEGYFSRVSRSAPLPAFVFSLDSGIEQLADRLVTETVLPLLRKFQGGRGGKWGVVLLNVCVANMVLAGSDDGAGVGRDISVMFRTQDEVLRPFRVGSPPRTGADQGRDEVEDEWWPDWDDFSDGEPCSQCGYRIPYFALVAHQRYHELGD